MSSNKPFLTDRQIEAHKKTAMYAATEEERAKALHYLCCELVRCRQQLERQVFNGFETSDVPWVVQ